MIFLPGRRRPTGRRELKAYIIIHGSGNKVNHIGPGYFVMAGITVWLWGGGAAPALLRGGGGLLPAEGPGQGGEFGDGQPLTADGGGRPQGLDGPATACLPQEPPREALRLLARVLRALGEGRPGPPGRSGPRHPPQRAEPWGPCAARRRSPWGRGGSSRAGRQRAVPCGRGTGRTRRRPRSPASRGGAQIRRATSRWIITVMAEKHLASNRAVMAGEVML